MRDLMTITLLEGSTPHTILARVRHEEMDGIPAYDRVTKDTKVNRMARRRRLRLRHYGTEAA